jgi:hypothetical protein
MSAQSDDYIAKRTEFDKIQRDRDAIIEFLVKAVDQLKSHPDRFSFSNTPGSSPGEVILSGSFSSVDGNKWPTAERIQAQLIQWHEAKRQLLDAWRGVPDSERGALQPPPAAQ